MRNKDRRSARTEGPPVPRTRADVFKTRKQRRAAKANPPPPVRAVSRAAPPAPRRAAPAPTREERILAAMAGLDPFNPSTTRRKAPLVPTP